MKEIVKSTAGSTHRALVNSPGKGNGAHIGRTFTITKAPGKNAGIRSVPVAMHEWVMDKNHSSLEFSAMYMKVVNAGGRFNNFEVKVKSQANDFSDAFISVVIRADSLDTGSDLRNQALKSGDWLNAVKYPVISFNSTSLKQVEGKKYELTGNLTLNGISHTITFDALFNGMFTNTYPKRTYAGFSIRGIIDRRKFELGRDDVGTGVGYEVAFGANIELVKE